MGLVGRCVEWLVGLASPVVGPVAQVVFHRSHGEGGGKEDGQG